MEKNLDRKTLSFSKGMTNIPSDLLSDDSELLESIGFIYRDGEMKPIQNPQKICNIPYKLQYVHKGADYKNIIAYDEEDKKLYCYLIGEDGVSDEPNFQSFEMDSLLDVKSIGNTLVCGTGSGIHYLLYKGGKYQDLGMELPELEVSFDFKKVSEISKFSISESDRTTTNLKEIVDVKKSDKSVWYDSNGNFVNLSKDKPSNGVNSNDYYYFEKPISVEREKLFQEAIQGQVAEGINWVKKHNLFAFPFFVRAAFRLFDGSYARITNPIICYPTVSRNRCVVPGYNYDNQSEQYIALGNVVEPLNFFYDIQYRQMYYKISFGDSYRNWSDIVKEVVVFATDQVLPFNIEGGWQILDPDKSNFIEYHNAVVNGDYEKYNFGFKYGGSGKIADGISARICVIPSSDNEKSDTKIINELLNKSQFYKLFSISISSGLFGSWHPTISDKYGEVSVIKDNVVETLTQQEQLQVDDYYGWTKKCFGNFFVYNNRLNAFSCKRYPYEGFPTQFAPTGESVGACFTHIKSSLVDTWVLNTIHGNEDIFSGWFYYPDPNATEAIIRYDDKAIKITLKQHPYLNGAYSFANLPSNRKQYSDTDWTDDILNDMNTGGYEAINSQIFTSVVNNPFVFEASGDNTVGTGKILGIVANTEAVSQGQFGQYPLMVFTDEGIYGMSVNSEGLYSATYPISREVCNENSPLVPTDRLIFFAAKKGLMAASGGSVGCMSELLRGRTPLNFATLGEGKFIDFLKDCLIAYDYRDSILRIFGKDKSYQYIYNMVDKTFSIVDSGMVAQAVVNDYPDNLIQDTGGNVYSLTDKPDINEDTNSYNGSITTRPLKLGGSMTLKSLRNIKNLRSTQTGKLQLEVWGSNNAIDWCKLNSLKGKPWSYFTFRYTLTDFKACDSFVGSIVDIQNRREQR